MTNVALRFAFYILIQGTKPRMWTVTSACICTIQGLKRGQNIFIKYLLFNIFNVLTAPFDDENNTRTLVDLSSLSIVLAFIHHRHQICNRSLHDPHCNLTSIYIIALNPNRKSKISLAKLGSHEVYWSWQGQCLYCRRSPLGHRNARPRTHTHTRWFPLYACLHIYSTAKGYVLHMCHTLLEEPILSPVITSWQCWHLFSHTSSLGESHSQNHPSGFRPCCAYGSLHRPPHICQLLAAAQCTAYSRALKELIC